MSNYVHNYVFCDENAKDRIHILKEEDYKFLSGCYDKKIIPIEENKFLVMFDTRGMEYSTEFICLFIKNYKNTTWYCIEENEIEEGHFFWNGSDVGFEKRKISESLDEKEILIKYEDNELRPYRTILISDEQIIFENLLKNEMKKYYFSERNQSRINDYISSLLIKKSDEFDSVPIKDEVGRELVIHWENQTYYIDFIGEGENPPHNINDDEATYENIISFFNSILKDEGIEEVISFEIKNIANYL